MEFSWIDEQPEEWTYEKYLAAVDRLLARLRQDRPYLAMIQTDTLSNTLSTLDEPPPDD